jgi:hypothetical protein
VAALRSPVTMFCSAPAERRSFLRNERRRRLRYQWLRRMPSSDRDEGFCRQVGKSTLAYPAPIDQVNHRDRAERLPSCG